MPPSIRHLWNSAWDLCHSWPASLRRFTAQVLLVNGTTTVPPFPLPEIQHQASRALHFHAIRQLATIKDLSLAPPLSDAAHRFVTKSLAAFQKRENEPGMFEAALLSCMHLVAAPFARELLIEARPSSFLANGAFAYLSTIVISRQANADVCSQREADGAAELLDLLKWCGQDRIPRITLLLASLGTKAGQALMPPSMVVQVLDARKYKSNFQAQFQQGGGEVQGCEGLVQLVGISCDWLLVFALLSGRLFVTHPLRGSLERPVFPQHLSHLGSSPTTNLQWHDAERLVRNLDQAFGPQLPGFDRLGIVDELVRDIFPDPEVWAPWMPSRSRIHQWASPSLDAHRHRLVPLIELEGPDRTGRCQTTLGAARYGLRESIRGRRLHDSLNLLERCIDVGPETIGMLAALTAGDTVPYSAENVNMVSVVINKGDETISKRIATFARARAILPRQSPRTQMHLFCWVLPILTKNPLFQTRFFPVWHHELVEYGVSLFSSLGSNLLESLAVGPSKPRFNIRSAAPDVLHQKILPLCDFGLVLHQARWLHSQWSPRFVAMLQSLVNLNALEGIWSSTEPTKYTRLDELRGILSGQCDGSPMVAGQNAVNFVSRRDPENIILDEPSALASPGEGKKALQPPTLPDDDHVHQRDPGYCGSMRQD